MTDYGYGAVDYNSWSDRDESAHLVEDQLRIEPRDHSNSLDPALLAPPPVILPPAPPVFGRKKQLSVNKQMIENLPRLGSSVVLQVPKAADFSLGRPEDLLVLRRVNSMSKVGKITGKAGQNPRARKNVGAYRRRRQDFDTWKGRVGVHVPVDQIDLKALVTVILDYLPGWDLIDHYDVIRVWMPPDGTNMFSGIEDVGNGGVIDLSSQDASMPEVYIFSFGAVVFWNFQSEIFEKAWMDMCLLKHTDIIGNLNDPAAMDNACDEMGFIYGDANKIYRDVIQLSTRDSAEKLAMSFAFAKSALLSIFEWRLEKTIERNSEIPEELAKTGHINLSRAEISKEIGRIYLVKHGIHLDNNLLDTPEEFWEDDKFQEEYNKAMNYFDVFTRLNLINTRLSVMSDLNELLMEAVQNHHAVALEWIVILLILGEILVELFRSWRELDL